PRRRVDEVPGAQFSLLALDEQQALAGEDEEVLLLVLAVIEPVGLAGLEHVEPEAELRELGPPGLERALRAGRPLLAAGGAQPLRVSDVDDEPALAGRREARALV